MTIIAFATFSGVAPKLTPWRLPAELAQVALNVNLESRTLRPWSGLLDIQTGLVPGDPSTIYRFGLNLTSDTQYWFHWAGLDVDVVKGPIVGDVTERTFYTGDGAPKWTNNTIGLTAPPYPSAFRDLGVTAPTAAPSVSVTGSGAGTAVAQTYVYTNVTAYGEESQPSPASAQVDVQSGQTVTLSGFSAAPTGTSSTTARRIYRSITSASGVTAYYFVKEIATSVTSTIDDVADAVGEPIASTDWAKPPSDMFGLTVMANGVLVGFSGNDVCLSEAYVPYAWPLAYRLSTDYPIVGGKAIGNQTVVLTTGVPYLLQGTDPGSMSLTKLDWPQACVAKRSIVNVGGVVMFASPDGLCAIDGTGALVVATDQYFARADWQALNPESMHGWTYNNKYFGFFDTGDEQGGFIFEPRESDAAFSFIDTYATAGFSDLVQDDLFLKVGTKIQKWNSSGSYSDYVWRSGVTTVPKPENFGAAQVWADTYPVTFKLYGDGVLMHTQTVLNANAFRLPAGFKSSQYEMELSGANEVYKAFIASTMQELAGV